MLGIVMTISKRLTLPMISSRSLRETGDAYGTNRSSFFSFFFLGGYSHA
jgi:hypothetical protein